MQNRVGLSEITNQCLKHFSNFRDEVCVVRDSIPILYFGDYDRYLSSPIKVVTVALNPSLNEFPSERRRKRFRYSFDDVNSFSEQDYRRSLDEYFHVEPYDGWFKNGFEKVLTGFGASYYGTNENHALHTDFCTPIATDPTWGKLGSKEFDPNYVMNRRIKKNMQKEGAKLWHTFIEFLQPDIIFSCLNSSCKIEFTVRQTSQLLLENPKTESERAITFSTINLESGKETILIKGRTRSIPFGSIKDQRKDEVGRKAMDLLKNKNVTVNYDEKHRNSIVF